MVNDILKITKTDGSIHFVPNNSSNKAMYEKHNAIKPDKVKVEEITSDEMNNLIKSGKLIDETQAKKKEDLVSENEKLKAQLAELQNAQKETQAKKKEETKPEK